MPICLFSREEQQVLACLVLAHRRKFDRGAFSGLPLPWRGPRCAWPFSCACPPSSIAPHRRVHPRSEAECARQDDPAAGPGSLAAEHRLTLAVWSASAISLDEADYNSPSSENAL